MAKRFTDTNKYKKPFIRGLQGAYKVLWDYLYHDCDHAGIWIVDFEIAQIMIGKDMPVNKEDALKYFNAGEERIIPFDNNTKWYIPAFITFQYGRLNPSNRAHNSVIQLLEKYKLSHSDKPHVRGLEGCKDKDKDLDKDKDKGGILSVFATFQNFMIAYPKGDDPDAAQTAWDAQPETNHLAIINSAKVWAKYWIKAETDHKWIKSPANFISKGMWKTKPTTESSDKDCFKCTAPYEAGKHKYGKIEGKKVWKCQDCKWD